MIRRHLPILPLSVLVVVAACGNAGTGGAGGGTSTDASAGPSTGTGSTGGDFGEALLQAICGYRAKCGNLNESISEWNDGNGNSGMSCDVSVAPVTLDECTADLAPILSELPACSSPTTAQQARLDTCVSKLEARTCPTQAALDAYAAAFCPKDGAPDAPPPECGVLTELFIQCHATVPCPGNDCLEGKYVVSCELPTMPDAGCACTCTGPFGPINALVPKITKGPEIVNCAVDADALCGWTSE